MLSLRLLCAASSLACAALVGCEDPGRSEPVRVPVEGAVAAEVNGEPVYLADVELEAAAQGAVETAAALAIGDAAYGEILEQLIDQKLLAQEAVARGLDLDANAQRRLNAARERVLGNLLVEHLVATQVTEERVAAMYAEQAALQQIEDQVRLARIVVATQDAAEAARTRIASGEAFADIAVELSEDSTTRAGGGELGYVEPNRLGEPFSSTIANTGIGEVSQPFETDEGWNLITVQDRRTPPPQTLAEMRPDLVTFLTLGEISQILSSLRREAEITPGPLQPQGRSGEAGPPGERGAQ
ncbi:MAG: peptidylprolyl isomerase [Pseudomonadota bacterium]